jgi:hypothetical protein
MDIEFHYYITFILCRKAGYSGDDAYKIAYSSQYTDDNKRHYYVNYPNGGHFLNEISQTMDITKPSRKRQKIYPLFHFVPGGTEAEETCSFDCDDEKCFVTIPNSENANILLKDALASEDLYRIGIAIHAFADTWSHQNFLGMKHDANGRNRVDIIPNIGHADFFHEPDKIHNEWKDPRLEDDAAIVNNDDRFIEAARQIFIHLYRVNNSGSDDSMAAGEFEELNLEKQLRDAMDESYWIGFDSKARIASYEKICEELGLEKYEYDAKQWRHAAVDKRDIELDHFDKYWAGENFLESDWYQFQMAVNAHRDDALIKLRPLYEQVGFV